MNTPLFRQIISCLLIFMLFLSWIPTGALAVQDLSEDIPEETACTESIPEETFTPEEPVPEETVPETTATEETVPETSAPEETVSESSAPEETEPETTVPEESEAPSLPDPPAVAAKEASGEGLYFGQLHAHSTLSDGYAEVGKIFELASQADNLDFLAVTDHSDSFDNHLSGSIDTDGSSVSLDWAAGKAAANAVTTSSFVAMFGYEMSWPHTMQIGHISTFGTPGFESWDQDAYRAYDSALSDYYGAMASVPGCFAQFNHPGTQYGTFCDFGSYSEEADRVMTLLEVDFDDTNPYRYYHKALDMGWHIAPTCNPAGYTCAQGNFGSGRTAVYARSLTEADISDALRNYRTYATEDADLEIHYSMDGHFMGSRLDLRHVGTTADITVTLSDPTDNTIGLVEVITAGGNISSSQSLSGASGTLSFSLSPDLCYYYLRITQPDGDTAITAPIWVDTEESLGIRNLSCETTVPVQNEPVSLTLELYNQESSDFQIDALEILADGIPVAAFSDPDRIPGCSNSTHTLTFSCDRIGVTEIKLRIHGMLEGSPRTYETALMLRFRLSRQATDILYDSGHGNAGLKELSVLKQLAMDEHIRLTPSDHLTSDQLKNCRFLLVTAPAEPFSLSFLNTAAEYAASGGSIMICGQAENQRSGFRSTTELNKLLSAIGSSMAMEDNLVQDPVSNGGTPDQIYTDHINRTDAWCAGVSENQVFRFISGCSINPGAGIWLIKAPETAHCTDDSSRDDIPLMARETLSGGGTVLACGSLFLSDVCLEESKNLWDEPYANRIIGGNLLGIGGEVLPLSTIRQAREADRGTLVRIRGYVTAGTANPFNQFPDTLYLQDDTGGISITPFQAPDIQNGTPLEITGTTDLSDGNVILKLISHKTMPQKLYRYQPLQGSWKKLLDPAENGSRLVEVEGKCLEVYCWENDILAGCLLKDDKGNQIAVRIEDYILNGSDGENNLHKQIRRGRTIRAAGFLHTDEYGETVIRVRNCEEVAWVPPRRYWNPKTGDALPVFTSALGLSLAGLLLLKKKKST